MNNKFDQLAKSVAESVTRRQALRRFGLGLATIALAGFGFKARALGDGAGSCVESGVQCDRSGFHPHSCVHCCSGFSICNPTTDGDHCVCQ